MNCSASTSGATAGLKRKAVEKVETPLIVSKFVPSTTPLLSKIKKELDEELRSLRKLTVSTKVDEAEIINLDSDDDSILQPQKGASKLPEEVSVKPKAAVLKKVVRKRPIISAVASTSSVHQMITQKFVSRQESSTVRGKGEKGLQLGAVNTSFPVAELVEHHPLAVIRVFTKALSDDLLAVLRSRIYVRLKDFCTVNGARDYRYLLWPIQQDYATRAGYFEARKYFFSSQSLFIEKINNCFRREFGL